MSKLSKPDFPTHAANLEMIGLLAELHRAGALSDAQIEILETWWHWACHGVESYDARSAGGKSRAPQADWAQIFEMRKEQSPTKSTSRIIKDIAAEHDVDESTVRRGKNKIK